MDDAEPERDDERPEDGERREVLDVVMPARFSLTPPGTAPTGTGWDPDPAPGATGAVASPTAAASGADQAASGAPPGLIVTTADRWSSGWVSRSRG